jgi:hypothetical protein
MGNRRRAYRVSVGKLKGRKPLERPGRRWENITKMNLQEIRWRVG